MKRKLLPPISYYADETKVQHEDIRGMNAMTLKQCHLN
jgi:hypothetical protein